MAVNKHKSLANKAALFGFPEARARNARKISVILIFTTNFFVGHKKTSAGCNKLVQKHANTEPLII